LPPQVIPGTCQRPEYPYAAVRAEMQGSVKVRFDVDSSNRVVGMIIVKSSGHEPLDAATLAGLRTCQFNAGTRNGRPTPASAFVEYVWRLEEAKPGMPAARQ
jgi:protein TonB